jgi:hypothetical protein
MPDWTIYQLDSGTWVANKAPATSLRFHDKETAIAYVKSLGDTAHVRGAESN